MKRTLIIILFFTNFFLARGQIINNAKDLENVKFVHERYSSFREYMANKLRYPDDAIKEKVSGVLLVGFKLSYDGNIIESFCFNSLHKSIDAMVLDIISSSKGFWILPKDIIDKKESVSIILPIVFKVGNSEDNIDFVNTKQKMLDEVSIGIPSLDFPGYKKTVKLKSSFYASLKNNEYEKASAIIDELIRREPLNIEFLFKKIEIDLKLGNKQSDVKK